jgi:hypothetical protein
MKDKLRNACNRHLCGDAKGSKAEMIRFGNELAGGVAPHRNPISNTPHSIRAYFAPQEPFAEEHSVLLATELLLLCHKQFQIPNLSSTD